MIDVSNESGQPAPEAVSSSGSSAPPESSKRTFAEFIQKRVPGKVRQKGVPWKIRIKVLETWVDEQAISKNGNPYTQVAVRYQLLPSMEEHVKRTADFTKEGELILQENPQPGRIYEITEKEGDDGFVIWIAIKPVSDK